ncbi:MAG: SprT-like domain-containing protein [Bacteroidota bacterium]|nr:SprT-like domain-containing protein [Bacteroidota bacterium]
MHKSIKPIAVFYEYLPEPAVQYCYSFWAKYNFEFQIKKKRNSKLGDYRFDFRSNKHSITVNADLNKYAFLVTYLHEVAHFLTQIKYGMKAEPHGKEWKTEFVTVAKPLLVPEVFPSNILMALQKYFNNPKATSCADPMLVKALNMHDNDPSKNLLSDIDFGKKFDLNGRIFSKIENRRTRVLCLEIASGKKYLISKAALVDPEIKL